jgi:hypothetical protein
LVIAAIFLLLVALAPSFGQTIESVRLYSEMTRIDPFGKPLLVDHPPAAKNPPREMLSPAVARNAFFSVQFAVSAPPRTNYFLAVQAYPPNVLRWKVYRERFEQRQGQWIPDALIEEEKPYFEVMPDLEVNIPGQNTQVYLIDVWVSAEIPSSGVRLEMLAKTDTWRMAPMEVRIYPNEVPALASAPARESALPDPLQPMDTVAAAILDAFRAGHVPGAEPAPPRTLRDIVRRNAIQDAMLARALGPDASKRCLEMRPGRTVYGSEWYLRIRDCLVRAKASAAGR